MTNLNQNINCDRLIAPKKSSIAFQLSNAAENNVIDLTEDEVQHSTPLTLAENVEKGMETAQVPENYTEDRNRWYCNICKRGGELLCCDRCPRAFHLAWYNFSSWIMCNIMIVLV